MSVVRYGPWRDADEPLAPPFNLAEAVDEIGAAVLAGATPADALRQCLRRGPNGLPGLEDLCHRVQERQYALRLRGKLDGTLGRARALLTEALAEERRVLFPDPGDEARLREGELASLPDGTARAVRQLASYAWRSSTARERYGEITALLRQEILDARFQGLRQWLHGATPPELRRLSAMLAELNQLVDADGRGESTKVRFARFVAEYDDFFPAPEGGLEELLDALARHAAAAERVLCALTADQRIELAELASQTLADSALQAEMSALSRALQARRPDLDWTGPSGAGGATDAEAALAELTDLGDLEEALAQRYPGASLDDVDPDLVDRVLGPQAVAELRLLRMVERDLVAAGYLVGRRDGLALSARAIRRLGQTALRETCPAAARSARPATPVQRWRPDHPRPVDAIATVANAARWSRGAPLRLREHDTVAASLDDAGRAAVVLCVDLSFSMGREDAWVAMKRTALALCHLVETRHPEDSAQLIGFSRLARVLRPAELATVDCDLAQGVNLHHALVLAGRRLRQRPRHTPVVLVIAGGEPTAHLGPAGQAVFSSPAQPQTVRLTMSAVDALSALDARIEIFRPAENARLDRLATTIARRNGGRSHAVAPDQLAARVVESYLTARQRPTR